MIVEFKVLELLEPVKTGSKLKINGVYKGELISDNRVLFEDTNYIEWIFYINDTCELITN